MTTLNKKAFQILVYNTTGVLSRISGLFARRGYNIESITAGVTADPRFTRITIVASGDDEILEQIEKLPPKVQDEFKTLAKGAAIAAEAMQKNEKKPA